MNVLFVCTGNTCRSPMAEGLFRAINEAKHENHLALSAGLFTAPGAEPTPNAVKAVAGDVDISEHRSRAVSPKFIDAADVVIGMTMDHKNVLLRQYPFDKDKIFTLGEWAGTNEEVEDPFGQDQSVYDACAAQIKQLLEKGWTKLEK